MADGVGSQAASVLQVLADLSPSAQQRSSALTIPLDWFRWLPASGVRLFPPEQALAFDRQGLQVAQGVPVDRRLGERLAAIDRIRPGEHRSLRVGWLFVAGRRQLGEGRTQRAFHPLVSVPARVALPRSPVGGSAMIWAAGDVAVSDLVADPARRHELEARFEVGGGALDTLEIPEIPVDLLRRLDLLAAFATRAARAADLEAVGLRPVTAGPEELMRRDGLVTVAGVGIFTAGDVGGLSASASLRSWAGRDLRDMTAFHSLYLADDGDGSEADSSDVAGPTQVTAPFPLTPTQRRAVSVSRSALVSVVSGAAGTGKSHTVSAIACDAVGRGETVLVVAKSDAAVDALLVLLGEAPGPAPVIFGSSERRVELANRLAAGELRPAERAELESAERALRDAVAARDGLVSSIVELLGAEAAAQLDDDACDEARLLAPGLFDPACDLEEMRRLLLAATPSTAGWWARRRGRRALARAVALAGARPDVVVSGLAPAAEIARQARSAGALIAAGGLGLTQEWARLEKLEGQLLRLVGEWLALTSRSPARLTRASLAEVAVLGTALRSGRAARRDQLSRLDDRLTRALPLWVGTLGDVEDLMPPRAGLFDLVILDEASAIDQPLAAPALLRARRSVMVGDPKQLRHVSFLADDQLRRAAAEHGVDADPVLVGRLDVRRNSIFDIAVGAAPPTVLDEHFRSAPHLIDFVARRIYGGRLLVATRSPRTEACDCIDVVRGTDKRDEGGVVRGEVESVVDRLKAMVRGGEASVGVISPFRAQADALEKAVLDSFSVQEIASLDLRVGTVHAFQGNERDVVLVSLGIGEGDGATTWRFVQDTHLFAVMATRARQRLVLLLSAEPPPRGLLADYLAQADAPPGRPRPAGVAPPWAASVAEGLSAAGMAAITMYPTGRHTVDVCAGGAWRFVGLECGVHPKGPAAHVERHLALRRAGWELVDAYRSRYADDQGELVVELADQLRPGPVH